MRRNGFFICKGKTQGAIFYGSVYSKQRNSAYSMSIPSAVFRLHLAREILDISSILDIKFSIYRLWEKTDIDGR